MKKKKQLISLLQWAKKNNYSDRHARRLAKEGKLPVKKMPIYIWGIEEDFYLK